jgi:hypothetical protein
MTAVLVNNAIRSGWRWRFQGVWEKRAVFSDVKPS